jgi:DNA-directed RNA polymerase specialized sigma24 family protein
MNPTEQHDFLNAIDALGQKELLILINGFSRQVVGTRFSCGMDLLHETMSRVLAGERQWRRDIPLGAFLHEGMRSVLSVDTRNPKSKPLSYEDWMSPVSDAPDDFGAPPEPLLIRVEEMAQARQEIDEARRRFSKDAEAHQLLNPESLDLTPAEARKAFGMSEKTYKAARERIARDIRTHAKRPWR